MNKTLVDLKLPKPFLVEDVGVVYGIDIGHGCVSYYDLILDEIQIQKYTKLSDVVSSMDKYAQLNVFSEHNLNLFPMPGESIFKVDGYCDFGNFLVFELTNRENSLGLELVSKTYRGSNSKLFSTKSLNVIKSGGNLSAETFQAQSDVDQYLTKIIPTPNSLNDLEKIILNKKLTYVK